MFCTQCGKENPNVARFCFSCGAQLVPAAAAPPLTPPSEASAPQRSLLGAADAPAAVPGYAGFWRRFAAMMLDSVLLSLIGGLLIAIAGGLAFGGAIAFDQGSGGVGAVSTAFGVVFWFAALLGGWLYYALSESSAAQATLGKRALGIYVTDLDGRRVSFARASGRWLGMLLNSLTLGIGWLLAAFTERKQGLHDLAASTLVLSRPNQSKTLVVVLIVLFIGLPVLLVTASIVAAGFAAAAGR